MHGGIAMSSGVDAGGGIAAAVILPAAVAYGAGWLAWQGGKLLLEVNRAADRQIAEKTTIGSRSSTSKNDSHFCS